MLLRFIPESRLIVVFPVLLLLLILTSINMVRKRNKDKNQQTLSVNVSFIYIVLNSIISSYLFSSTWRYKPDLNWSHVLLYFGLPIWFLFALYFGVITALIYKKTKKVSFMAWGILLCLLSAIAFGLSLIKILLMFNVIA